MKSFVIGILITLTACGSSQKPVPNVLLSDTLRVPKNFLKDTFPFYQAFVGKLGKDSVQLHLFKNRYYENTFTATLYEVQGQFFKVFQGETHFQQPKEGYVLSYNAGRMDLEIEYRSLHPIPYEKEIIHLRECSMNFTHQWNLNLQITPAGNLEGDLEVNSQSQAIGLLQPIKSDFKFENWACRNAKTTLDVALPWQQELLMDSETQSATPFQNPLLQILQTQVQEEGNDTKRNFSVHCIYQDHSYFAVGVQKFWLKGKRGGYTFHVFNYDTVHQKIIQWKDVLNSKQMTRLKELILQRLPKDMVLDKNNFVLMKQGVYFILTPTASYERDMGHFQGLLFKWEELK